MPSCILSFVLDLFILVGHPYLRYDFGMSRNITSKEVEFSVL